LIGAIRGGRPLFLCYWHGRGRGRGDEGGDGERREGAKMRGGREGG